MDIHGWFFSAVLKVQGQGRRGMGGVRRAWACVVVVSCVWECVVYLGGGGGGGRGGDSQLAGIEKACKLEKEGGV